MWVAPELEDFGAGAGWGGSPEGLAIRLAVGFRQMGDVGQEADSYERDRRGERRRWRTQNIPPADGWTSRARAHGAAPW